MQSGGRQVAVGGRIFNITGEQAGLLQAGGAILLQF